LRAVCIPVTGHMERVERSERITTREQLDHPACHIGKVGPLVPDTAAAGITDCRDRLEPVDRPALQLTRYLSFAISGMR
jgi:hypothetical protein